MELIKALFAGTVLGQGFQAQMVVGKCHIRQTGVRYCIQPIYYVQNLDRLQYVPLAGTVASDYMGRDGRAPGKH